VEKPAELFDRVHEWADLVEFATSKAAGLRIGIMRGRRRHGKSFLLEHLCRVTGGLYTLALRQSRAMALARFAESLESALGHAIGRFGNWVQALDAAVDGLGGQAGNRVPLLVLDEFPYLAAHSPELPSAIQALYDQRGPSTRKPPFRLVLCGSAISVMSTVLAGDQALRGRAVLDQRIGPFRFRDSAQFWDAQPAEALRIDAVLGGAPGYRDIVGDAPAAGANGFFRWLSRTMLNPSHVLFAEPEYLLAEDPRMSDRATYHSIWEAVARGAAKPAQIGGLVGMESKALAYHLRVMHDGGFLRHDEDLLWQRKPIITVADPAVRFHHLIVRPNLIDLESRNPRAAWDRSHETFMSKVLGPHFEHLCREWTKWYAGFDEVGHVGQTQVPCRAHRGHEVDVVALDRHSSPRAKAGRVVLLGEAKLGGRVDAAAELERLNHIRDILDGLGWDTKAVRFVIFAADGFANRPENANLVDLRSLYGR
jgi:AAA+ ATPase superfamily predicted ATPase